VIYASLLSARDWLIGLRQGARHALAGSPPLLVLHLLETGLREHVEPVVAWLLENDRSRIAVVVRWVQRAEYLRVSALPFGRESRLSLITEEQFHPSLLPASVVLGLHPEIRSAVAEAYGPGGPFRIVMQHGLPDKESFYVPDGRGDTLSCYDGVFLFGPASREGSLKLYAQANPQQFGRLRLFNVGYPKTDALLAGGFQRESFLRSQGLAPERPTICYAPTYQRTASLEQQGIDIIRTLASLGVNVLVKLHHVSLKTPGPGFEPWVQAETSGKNWRAIVSGLSRELPNIRLADVHSANPCFAASDVLVTDVSGAAFEFLLLDRPIVFVDVPEFFAAHGRVGIQNWGRYCGEIVSTLGSLKEVAAACMADPTTKRGERAKLARNLIYNPGRGTDEAGRTLRDLLRRRRG
jgi:hypothetical protein